MVVRIDGIRKFTFDVSNKNGTAHREFGRDQVEFVRLQSLRKMTGEGIGKRGRLALVFNLRVVIVYRRLSTTYGKAAVKRNLALGLGSEIQGITHIELILKDERKRGNFIGQEERESTFPTKKPPCAQQESQCAWRLEMKGLPKRESLNINKGNAMIITTFPVIFFIVQTSRPADVGTYEKRCSINEQRY